MTKIAKQDKVVRDEALGIDRRVLAGQTIPADLEEAYEKAGGSSEDAPDYEPREGQVIASKTVTIRDDALGINRRVIEGLPVPPDLVEAYEANAQSSKGKASPARKSKGEDE